MKNKQQDGKPTTTNTNDYTRGQCIIITPTKKQKLSEETR